MPATSKQVIITGSSGFIGSSLAVKMNELGYSTIGFDIIDGVDITDISSLNDFLKDMKTEEFDAVFHLAAKMFIPDAWKNPFDTYKVNVFGTLNVLELCRVLDVNRFIFASSYLYGEAEYLPIDEKHPLKPSNPYAYSKYLAEEACKGYYDDYGINCVILRPFNIYGPGQPEKFLIPTIIKQLDTGKIQLKDPEPKRDYLYVTDMVDAYVRTVDFKGSGYDIFNIGYGKSYSVQEIVDLILELSGSSAEVSYSGERRQAEVMDVVADITSAKEKLDWGPKVDVEEGLRKIMEAEGLL